MAYGPICPVCGIGITGVRNFANADLPGYMVINTAEAVQAMISHMEGAHEIAVKGHSVEYTDL